MRIGASQAEQGKRGSFPAFVESLHSSQFHRLGTGNILGTGVAREDRSDDTQEAENGGQQDTLPSKFEMSIFQNKPGAYSNDKTSRKRISRGDGMEEFTHGCR